MHVKDVMNPSAIFIEVPGTREQAMQKLKEKRISGLPVIRKGTKKIVGILTREDLFLHPDEDQLALIMNSNVVTISPDSSLEECVKIMLEKRYRRLPVASNGDLKGIIAVGDVIGNVIAKSESKLKVKDFMRTSIFGIWGNTPVYIASRVMRLSNENVALVIDNEEQIAGIVSNADLMDLGEVRIEETKSVLKSGSESQEWDWETSSVLYITKGKIALPKIPLHEVMVTPCITITENESIKDCASKMRQHNVDQLPVVGTRNEILGIIFDLDLLKSLF